MKWRVNKMTTNEIAEISAGIDALANANRTLNENWAYLVQHYPKIAVEILCHDRAATSNCVESR
tara:strand:- start:834 stop:1025 length:192 start_codon:yes stop_codon:yes gene_type:complete